MKKILFVASECVPFIKTGGLADVAGSLPKAFDPAEYDIRVVIPYYQCIKPQFKEQAQYLTSFYMDDVKYVGIMTLVHDGITYYFIDNQDYFSGETPYYDLFSDIERFAYFSKAALSILPNVDFHPDIIHCHASPRLASPHPAFFWDFHPDIIHCHDWQASLVPVYLHTLFKSNDFYYGIKTVMTIHNLKFQGAWNVPHIQGVSGLPDECFIPGRLVPPEQDTRLLKQHQDASMLRGGLVYADYITTVSNTYASEIQTPEKEKQEKAPGTAGSPRG